MVVMWKTNDTLQRRSDTQTSHTFGAAHVALARGARPP
jgi:hypothetical protein